MKDIKFNLKEDFGNMITCFRKCYLKVRQKKNKECIHSNNLLLGTWKKNSEFLQKGWKRINDFFDIFGASFDELSEDIIKDWPKSISMIFILWIFGVSVSQYISIWISSGDWQTIMYVFSWTQVVNNMPISLITLFLLAILAMFIASLLKIAIKTDKNTMYFLIFFYVSILLAWIFIPKMYIEYMDNWFYYWGILMILLIIIIVISSLKERVQSNTLNNSIKLIYLMPLFWFFSIVTALLTEQLFFKSNWSPPLIEIKDKEYDSAGYYTGYSVTYQNDKWVILRNNWTWLIILPSSRVIAVKNSPFLSLSNTWLVNEKKWNQIIISWEIKIGTWTTSK